MANGTDQVIEPEVEETDDETTDETTKKAKAAQKAKEDAAKAKEEAALQKEVDAENAKLTGIGPRFFVGWTRGLGTQLFKYAQFDKSQPATLPKETGDFLKLVKLSDAEGNVVDEAALMSILIDGWNAQSYKAASDPIAQYLNPEWDEDVVKSFRLVVRNYSVNANVSIADAVTLIKPGIEAAHQKAKTSA